MRSKPGTARPLSLAVLCVHSSPLGRAGTKDTGGMSTYLRETARALGARGHRLDLYTRASAGQNPGASAGLAPGARLVYLAAGPGELAKLELYPYLTQFSRNLECYRRAHGLCYDLVFSHYWLSGQAGRSLGRLWRVPHAVMFHTLGAAKNAAGGGEEEPARRVEAERLIARRCSRVIVAAQREKEELARRCAVPANKIAVIPCGVNRRLFRPLDRRDAAARIGFPGEKIILYAGRIDPVKGLDLLIQAVRLLPEKRGVRLVIAGEDGPGREVETALRKLARALGIERAVTFAGAVEHALLPYYYSAAAVTVVPSRYESFGLAALESLSCGTPVVAADVADLRAIIREGETGFVIGSRAPGEFAARIAACLAGNRLQPAAQISASVAGFSWENTALRLEQEFTALTGGT